MLHPACDLEIAERVAKELGAIHKIIQVNEMELEAIRTNPVNRCYICKHHLFATLLDFAKEEGIPCVMDGTNESDLHVYRPGIQALRELGVVSPLAQCGLEKKDVKAFAADLGISVASRPSMPCMATRLPYGTSFDMEVCLAEMCACACMAILSGSRWMRINLKKRLPSGRRSAGH